MRSKIAVASGVVTRWRVELLDLLFPRRCISCRRIGHAFCPACLSEIRLIAPPFCQRCGEPFVRVGEACRNCREHPRHFESARSAGLFEGPLRLAIHAIKYNRRTDLVGPLAVLLERQLEREPVDFDLITAVPLHRTRERERGYNQSELLARELARRAGRPYLSGLSRIRATADQVGLNPAQRHANVRDAFQVEGNWFRDQGILLIDDVCTTGATLDACAAALQAKGAKAIHGLTVARPREFDVVGPSTVLEGENHQRTREEVYAANHYR